MKKSPRTLREIKVIQKGERFLDSYHFPGNKDKSILFVLRLFFAGLKNNVLANRASAISFKFLMAAIPALIFILSMLPVLFNQEALQGFLSMLHEMLPKHVYQTAYPAIEDILENRYPGFASFLVVTSFYFALNGIRAIMAFFNASYHIHENRKIHKQFAVAFLMAVILTTVIIIATGLFVLNAGVYRWAIKNELISFSWSSTLFQWTKYFIFFLILILTLSWLYYLAPAKRARYRFLTPGTFLASLSTVLTSVGFDYFISNFSRYNEIYGSLSALFILMFWVYLNSFIILIGFEINVAAYIAEDETSKPKPFSRPGKG